MGKESRVHWIVWESVLGLPWVDLDGMELDDPNGSCKMKRDIQTSS